MEPDFVIALKHKQKDWPMALLYQTTIVCFLSKDSTWEDGLWKGRYGASGSWSRYQITKKVEGFQSNVEMAQLDFEQTRRPNFSGSMKMWENKGWVLRYYWLDIWPVLPPRFESPTTFSILTRGREW